VAGGEQGELVFTTLVVSQTKKIRSIVGISALVDVTEPGVVERS